MPYEGHRFDHSDGKYRFPDALHEEAPPPENFPIRLLTLIRRDAMHSQISPDAQPDVPILEISGDCTALGTIDPMRDVDLVSPNGRLRVVLEQCPGLHPETAILRRGGWLSRGGCGNRIIAGRVTDMGDGAAYYEQYVRLENG